MKFTVTRRLAGMAALCLTLSTGGAGATEGYMALGYGPIQRGHGGAGVAERGHDAMSMTINPASIIGVGRSLTFGMELFMPDRGYTGTGTGFVAPGRVQSGREAFLVPNFAYTTTLANGATLGVAAYGNGGMNTSYDNIGNASPGCAAAGGSGVFCGGPAGVDLSQLFLSVAYAQQSGALSWGIAPTVAIQNFKARGLGAFAPVSADPANLTDRGRDWSYGLGLRAGITVDVTPGLRFGLAGQTKIGMTKFDRYAGLFADGGDFDIPAQITAGLAWDATPSVTVMADWQKIFYSGVPSVSNPFVPAPLGSRGGPGFGWDDVEVVKLGIEWEQSPRMTWRAGYARASNPIGPEDVTLGILAPGVVEDHWTFGGSWRPNDRDSVDFAVVYVPRVRVTGPEVTPAGLTPGSSVQIGMDQLAVSIGWSRKF